MKKILLLSLSLMWASVFAGEKEDAEKAIRAQIAAKLPNMTVEYIDATPVPGLYEVSVSSNLIYMSADGRYILVGDLTDMETSTNLTEEKRNKVRKSLMDSVDETQTIVFSPENPKYMVTVFTDIDCGYCRKMHSEIAEYNELGIGIRYLFYPRSGIGQEAYRKAVAVWCSDDRKAALTAAKQGEALPEKSCENPVAEQYLMGEKVGLRGTPALILENGAMFPGYLPPKRLLPELAKLLGN